jgi:prevent-host-death family protein
VQVFTTWERLQAGRVDHLDQFGVMEMVRRVRAAEAKANLPELIARDAFGGERYIIDRRGKPVAALVGVADLERLQGGEAGPDQRRGALALVGAWAEMPDEQIDAIFEEVTASRTQQASRPVPVLD